MVHLWVRAEQRPNEERVGLTPEGAAALIGKGFRVTVEESPVRALPLAPYRDAGCAVAPYASWPTAPADAIIFGLKELPEDGTALRHRHILFGHAYKGQPAGPVLLARFRAGGGTLYDLESLVDARGRRVAAFGYWAGFAGAGISVKAWAAQQAGGICPPVARYADKAAMIADLAADLGDRRPDALVIGALGRVGAGAADLLESLGLSVTRWDMAETASGGPFPEVLAHDLFFQLHPRPAWLPGLRAGRRRHAGPQAEGDRRHRLRSGQRLQPGAGLRPRHRLGGAGDPRARRTAASTSMAIDNLPSLLPVESSQDFAAQLLPHLLVLDAPDAGVWGRARAEFERFAG